jgi:thioredoxin 1
MTKSEMSFMATLSFGDAEFEKTMLDASVPVLVAFVANWCGPSVQLDPVLDETAAESAGKITLVKVDIDQNPFIQLRYGVRACPTLILFKDGRPFSTKIGSLPKAKLLDWLDSIGAYTGNG